MTAWRAILLGIGYYFCKPYWPYGWSTGVPLFSSMVIGVIMGDLTTALIIGAAIQATYMGWLAVGPGIPSDQTLATFIAVPLAIQSNLSPEVAVTLAVPVGLMGLVIHNIRRTVNATWIHMADRSAEEADTAGIARAAYLYPALLMIPLHIIPVALAVYFGPTAANAFLASVPGWILHGLEVAGGMLPALGFALTITMIGKKSLIPYFLAGFLISRVSSLGSITLALFSVILGILHVQYTQRSVTDNGN